MARSSEKTEKAEKKSSKRAPARGGGRKVGKLTLLGLIIAVVVGAAFFVYQSMGQGPIINVQSSGKAYYSDDDGKTIFADDSTKLAPFDHNGKQAMRAYCYTTDNGKTHWVDHLERWTPQGKRAWELFNQRKPDDRDPFDRQKILESATEVKLPGAPESEWTGHNNPKKFISIATPKRPAGKSGDVRDYLP